MNKKLPTVNFVAKLATVFKCMDSRVQTQILLKLENLTIFFKSLFNTFYDRL